MVEMHCVISINQALAAKNECELAGENRINGLNTCEWPVNQQMYAGKVSQCSSIRLFYMVPGKDIGENSFINFYYFCIKGYQCLRLNLAKNSQNYTNNASQPCQALVIYWSSQTRLQFLKFLISGLPHLSGKYVCVHTTNQYSVLVDWSVGMEAQGEI
jgi:hypothetical protein